MKKSIQNDIVKSALDTHIHNVGLCVYDVDNNKSLVVTSSNDIEKFLKSKIRVSSQKKDSAIRFYKLPMSDKSFKGYFDKDYEFTVTMNVENEDNGQLLKNDSVVIMTDNLDILYELGLMLSIYKQTNAIKNLTTPDYYRIKDGAKKINPITVETMVYRDEMINIDRVYDKFTDLNNLGNDLYTNALTACTMAEEPNEM